MTNVSTLLTQKRKEELILNLKKIDSSECIYHILLKNIIPIYSEKNNFSSHIKSILFNNEKMNFYTYVKSLELKDPTAEWDPLEDVNDDEYYSSADLAIKKEMDKQKSLLRKIIDFFK